MALARGRDFGGETVGGAGAGRMPDAVQLAFVAGHGDADLAFDAGGHLGEEVAALVGGGDDLLLKLGVLGAAEGLVRGFDVEDRLLDELNLVEDAGEFGCGCGCEGVAKSVEESLEEDAVAAAEGVVGLGHEAGAVVLVACRGGAVGVDAFDEFAEERLEGFEIERRGGMRLGALDAVDVGGAVGSEFGFEGFERGVVRVQSGEAAVPLVELAVEHADLAEVAALEADEVVAEVAECELLRGERGAEGFQLDAAESKLGFSGGGLAEDGGGHGTRTFKVSLVPAGGRPL